MHRPAGSACGPCILTGANAQHKQPTKGEGAPQGRNITLAADMKCHSAWNTECFCNTTGQLPLLHTLVGNNPGQSVPAVASFGHFEAHSMLAR